MSGKKGGAPAGNTNALKHGFYSRRFREIESHDLDALTVGLESEIALLRVYLRRTLEVLDEQADSESWLKVLLALGVTCTRIAYLSKSKVLLGSQGDETLATISAAISAVNKELGLQ